MKNNLDRLLEYLLEEETAKSRHLFENGVGGDFPEDKIPGGDVSNGKKLLLLVHPDIVFETGKIDFIEEYIQKLRDEMPKFDYVITHKFFSDYAPELIDNIGKNLDLWNKLMDVLEAESDWIKRDYKFSASFSDALPYYLIENEGTQIWLGGGYEKLCVADTQKALMKKLGDVIGETGAYIAGCYAPLIITQRHNPSFGDQPVKEHYSALRECIKMITENEIKQRSHMSKEEIGEFKNILPNEQEISHKPKGFWYDCDGEWSNWVQFNMPEWMGEHEYDVELDHSKMIVIRNFQQLKEFNEKYSIKPEESEDLDNDYLIDWRRVAAEYAGIEICPYISKVQQIRETGKVYEWYSTWDVASGCVWNREAIKSIEKKNKKSLGNDIWYHTTSRKNWEKIREQGLKVGSPPKFSMASLEYMSSIYGRVPLFFSKSPDLYRNLQSGDDLVTLEVDLSGIPKLADIPSLIDHGANIDPDREIIWFEEEETPPSLQQFIDPDREGISFDELGHPGEVSNAVIELTGTCAIIQDINKDKIKIYN